MSDPQMQAVVSPAEAVLEPYPYVVVNDDGTARELHPAEREYLQTPFEPYDGARPYVKADFKSRDGWGSIKGFCLRSCVPGNISIAPAPVVDPNPPMTKAEHIELLKKRMVGFEIIAREDGTVEARRVAKPNSLLRRILGRLGFLRA